MATKLLNPRRRRGTQDTFNLRRAYLSQVVPSDKHDNFYDSSTVRFYGKINLNGDIVYPSEKYLTTLPNPNKKSGRTYYALNFVAKAFLEFREYYIKGTATGIVKSEDPLQIIEPVRGWESMHELYAANIDTLYSVLINDYIQSPSAFFGVENAYPKDFDEFIKSTKNLFISRGNLVKLSRSSFVLSTNCPLSTTGLAIEIGPRIDYSDDRAKTQNIYQSPNFDFYMKALKKFGFMADIDYPGRIVADIGSPAMQGYMEEFGITIDNLFDSYYYKAGEFDYDLIRVYLSQFYNSYVTDYPVRTVIKKRGAVTANKYSAQTRNFRTNTQAIPTPTLRVVCEKSTREVIERNKLTQSDLAGKYNDTYWIATYAQMLNYELSNVLDDNDLNKVIKNAQDINKNIDIDSAKSYINGVFKIFRFPN